MKTRQFGNTDLMVSEAGFGAWAIGGPAMAGDIAIGWGETDDDTSIKALKKAADLYDHKLWKLVEFLEKEKI